MRMISRHIQRTMLLFLLIASASGVSANSGLGGLLTDINQIQRYWGDATPYQDTPADYFGVPNSGLPYGCGYEQVQVLQRHGARYPSYDDNIDDFVQKIQGIQNATGLNSFYGDLDFLNRWTYGLQTNDDPSYLLALGVAEETAAGATFWQTRGRLLFNQTAGQPFYNATGKDKMLFRATEESRIYESAMSWATGFFGPTNTSDKYDLLLFPEEEGFNNTLGADNSCINDDVDAIGDYGEDMTQPYIDAGFLDAATDRLNNLLTNGDYAFTANDTYTMMEICSYEYAAYGDSQFCYLFTEDEWDGFEYTADLTSYYDDSYGNAVGRAQGIGILQETLARLKGELIKESTTSINTTTDNNNSTFPTGLKFYFDASHDFILLAMLTAESIDWLKTPIAGGRDPNRTFRTSYLTPFGTRLWTEVIGCADPNPPEVQHPYAQTTPESNGYDVNNAPYKFVRQLWNNAVVPLATIQGGGCAGRTDGLCNMTAFIQSQEDAVAKANYQYACFANYTNVEGNGDGAVFEHA